MTDTIELAEGEPATHDPDRFAMTARTRVRRAAQRANYDRDAVHGILDVSYVCQVAFTVDGEVHNIPTACWREDEYFYIHGSNGSRMIRALLAGAPACINVTHLDGLVLARSAFNHSMNYRSVVLYGEFTEVTDPAAKLASLVRFVDHIAPGRSQECRPPDANELAATAVLVMPITEAVAKVRTGGPKDDAADLQLPHWAGVLPLHSGRHAPEPAAGCESWPVPESLNRLRAQQA